MPHYSTNSTAEATSNATSGNHIVFFRPNALTPAEAKGIAFLEQSLGVKIQAEHSLDNLGSIVTTKPILLTFHIDMFNKKSVTLHEIVHVAHTLNKCVANSLPIPIAVGITKATHYETIREIRNADVVGIVPSVNDFGLDELLKGLVGILEDKSYWPRHIMDQLPRHKKVKSRKTSGPRLTPRQQQVLDLVKSRGLSNKKIAQALKISESTVKIHMSAILKQYQVRNRTQLALSARDQPST